MAVTEKTAKDRVKSIIDTYAKYNKLYTCCPMTFGFGESGHPDRLLLISGVFIGIEVKRDYNNHHIRPELKPKQNEAAQKRQAKKITDAGGIWLCIHNYNMQELFDLIEFYSAVKLESFSEEHRKIIAKALKNP